MFVNLNHFPQEKRNTEYLEFNSKFELVDPHWFQSYYKLTRYDS